MIFTVAVALQVGSHCIKAPVFVLNAENEEEAEAKALEKTAEFFKNRYGADEGQSYHVLDFSALEIPVEILRQYVEAHDESAKDSIRGKGDPSVLCLPSNMGGPWPTRDAIQRLAGFADDQLHRCSYDGHGYEELQVALTVVQAALRNEATDAEQLR